MLLRGRHLVDAGAALEALTLQSEKDKWVIELKQQRRGAVTSTRTTYRLTTVWLTTLHNKSCESYVITNKGIFKLLQRYFASHNIRDCPATINY